MAITLKAQAGSYCPVGCSNPSKPH
ncbi:hypothetical protein CFP56_012837 [Quercus suber]|uniref:Uncharacterized protein n=1 Tax=Quercus suber TaxID=58331 RepID=A0AAW0KUT3_QUESU